MTEEDAGPAPPPGFVRVASRSAFMAVNGPVLHKAEQPADGAAHALLIEARHTNALGVLHGGMLSAFLDALLGSAVHRVTGRTAVTVHLSVDFLKMARKGEWLIGEAALTHAAREVAFAEGRALVGDRVVGRATGVFKLMGRR